MEHPLRSVPAKYRKRGFVTFLILSVVMLAVFWVLDQPLWTEAAPWGIFSFEMAGNPQTARAITDSWKQLSLLLSSTGQPNPDIVNTPYVFAAFSLGIDYLFMPVYALALAFATLFAAQKHTGLLKALAVAGCYGAFAAVLFDALENFSLFQVLLGFVDSPYPAIAAFCAIVKFGLILFGIVVSVAGRVAPGKPA